uniref:A disintegrin and metalloproteinase with thrombospondin motifs 20-like n=1 Tax=Sinocyclocheilus anshuiensis TaxID=1608454 RepID=A0A671MMB3_9TELE
MSLHWMIHFKASAIYHKIDSFIRQLSAYEIITPVRLNDFGESFPHRLHYRRRRRSADAEVSGSRAHYRFEAFGQAFHLNLTADSGFIAPSYTVLHLGEEEKRGDAADLRHCFFRGHVNDRREHHAIFSLCTGLIGTFTTHSGQFFLEPLLSADGEEYEEEHNKPHLLYRHESHDSQPCSASGKRFSFINSFSNLHSNRTLEEEVMSIQETMRSEDGSRSRRKRFLSYPRFVELMVTADAKMVRHHRHNLEHYILTIMSVVAAIYRDPSVGNLINIVIVKLIVIHNEQEGPNINFYATATLHNFCMWQQSHNVLDDSHPGHHDTALLITREDICRAKDKCDTLGKISHYCPDLLFLQYVCGIKILIFCSSSLHEFNMPHDDSPKCREAGIKHQYHVMAPTLNYDTSPWSWSKCSRKYITDFLDTGYGECLLDEPLGRMYNLPNQLPGQLYNANRQCELMFGPGSQVCPFMKQCKRLWCTSAEGDHKGCRTQHMPLHCRHGMCVNKEMDMKPVHGEWGPWGPYSVCSRTCGGGTRSTTRDCNKPDVQNQQNNGKIMPKNSPTHLSCFSVLMKDRCKLFCRVAGTMAYYQLRDRVVDGTPCGLDTYDICVQGLCRQAGCDHVLNSKARNDKCGICGGDNSSCKTLAGTFNNSQYGYNVVVRIPAGATNIDIKQVSYSGLPEDDNYLALSDNQSNFLLNGNFVVSMFKREITFKGAEIEYSGSNTTVERINCTQRIEEELVLCVGNLYNPDVRYSFSIPIEEQREQFVWDLSGPWQECSRMCQGARRRKAVCVRKSDHLVVSEQRCENLPRPRGTTEPCNTDCELRWHVAGRSDCSSKCGPGYRALDVLCMRYSQNKRACADLPKPQTREGCHGDCLLKSWQYSTWSQVTIRYFETLCICSHQCLVTCGKGVRHRQVLCILGDEKLNEQRCDPNTKPSAVGGCELPECASWQVGAWSPCTVSCGQGYQMRAVRCVSGAYGETVDDRDCNAATRPRDSQDCELSACPRAASVFNTPRPAEVGQRHTQWRYGSWTSCSVSCGEGRRERYVSCRDAQGGVAEESSCAHLPRPPDSSVCFSPCGQWREGEWTPVSQTHSFSVLHGLHREAYTTRMLESSCAHLPRPPDSSVCFSPCGQWREGEWTPCSSSCEGGFQRRVVVCQDADGRSTNHCDERVKPDQSKSCDSGPCPHWNYGVWGQCSRSCGGGQRTRLVVCQRPSGQRLNEHSCDALDKPADVEQCNGQPCAAAAAAVSWHRRAWKPCSVSCGKGIKERQIVCVDQNQTQIQEHSCAHLIPPRTQKACRAGPCPSWRANRWRACSASCGAGLQSREVFCRSKGKGHVSDELCYARVRPDRLRSCFHTDCQTHSWTTHDWKDVSKTPSTDVLHYTRANADEDKRWYDVQCSECSQTCGAGVMHRTVQCLSAQNLPSQSCPLSSRPETHATCRQTDCELHTSCREVQVKGGVQKDGEHYIKVQAKILQIYCAEMQSGFPKEYVTLPSGQTDNYSEVYRYRLQNPFECPYNGSRRQDCACRNDYTAAGYTVFHRVRLDLSSMCIIPTDLKFSQTLFGRSVPFASAGDCYSAAKCPQGQFSINLSGTGLKVAESTKWVSQGNYVTVKVHRSDDGSRIYGRCGGFCGKCLPHPHTGLFVKIQ